MKNEEFYNRTVNPTPIRGSGKFCLPGEVKSLVRAILAFAMLFLVIDMMVQNRVENYETKLHPDRLQIDSDLLKAPVNKEVSAQTPANVVPPVKPEQTQPVETTMPMGNAIRLRDAR